ncbi:protein of unknown function [Roseibium suaedae]|uniref:DUF930 domain-containing protein n=2 Tax=Roseibium suaedae TaxID=735517 RepID=A0A1M7HPE7_9HYPH|nr:protein of unknown function [Roseibium suaedae]
MTHSGQNKRIQGSRIKEMRQAIRAVPLVAAGLVAGMAAFPAQGMAGNGYDRVPPSEQLEQSCDVEAMNRLDADKVIAYTFEDPVYSTQRIDAPGAVFRKNEEWYRLEYHCQTEKDHRTVVSFDWTVGEKIPRSDWDKYYLYP